MNYFKQKILEKRIEVLNKKEISFNKKTNEFLNKINKKDFEELINNKEMCKKIFVYFMLYKDRHSGVWHDRALSFIEGLINDLYILKETHNINITLPMFVHYFSLSNIVDLNQYLTQKNIVLVNKNTSYYLKFLPNKGIYLNSPQSQEMHGYITMQFASNLTKFIDYYGYSTKDTNKYEISKLKIINKIKDF